MTLTYAIKAVRDHDSTEEDDTFVFLEFIRRTINNKTYADYIIKTLTEQLADDAIALNSADSDEFIAHWDSLTVELEIITTAREAVKQCVALDESDTFALFQHLCTLPQVSSMLFVTGELRNSLNDLIINGELSPSRVETLLVIYDKYNPQTLFHQKFAKLAELEAEVAALKTELGI